MQSVQEALIRLTESVDRQEATVHAFQAKVFGMERDPVAEACAGFLSIARLRYPQTDANDDTNISHRNSMAIHPVSGESSSELGHHVQLRLDEHPKHYHLDHLDRLSNCSTWTPAPVSHSHNDPKGRQEVSPHCQDGSSHPQQSPNIERHAVTPHTRCIGTSDSTPLTINTHVVKCQATQMATPNIVANVLNKQSSQAIVQRVLHCFTCGGRGHKSRGCTSPKKTCVSCGGYGHATIDCPNCHALSRKKRRRRSGPSARNGGGSHSPGTPGSTSGGGCGHSLLGCSNHRKPTLRHRRLRREPKARERGEHYSTAAVVSASDPGQHHRYPCRHTTLNGVTPPDAIMRSDQCTCQNASKDADLSIVGIISIDEDACIHSEDGNHESLPMHIPEMTDMAPTGIASKAITSHCTVSNQHIAHNSVTATHCTISHQYIAPELVTAVHCTVSHQYIAPSLVTVAHCTVSYQHIAPDRTTHSVEPTDISPLALNTVNSPVHATTSSVEATDTSPLALNTVNSPVHATTSSVEATDISPLALNTVNSPIHATASSVEATDISPIAYDTVSSPANAPLKLLTPPDVRAPTHLPMCTVPSDAFISAAASGNKQVAMDMLFSDDRANVNAHDNKGRICLHWTMNCGMMRLAELLLCRADSHIDVLDDNGDTATILAAKMNDASVAMLMLGDGRNVTTVGELGQVVAQRNTVHEMMKNTAPFLSQDTMSATDAEATLRYCIMSSNTITALYSSCCSAVSALTYLCSERKAVDLSTACTIFTVVIALTYLMASLLAD